VSGGSCGADAPLRRCYDRRLSARPCRRCAPPLYPLAHPPSSQPRPQPRGCRRPPPRQPGTRVTANAAGGGGARSRRRRRVRGVRRPSGRPGRPPVVG